jgi:uncharacterized protein (TIRG00374 family)
MRSIKKSLPSLISILAVLVFFGYIAKNIEQFEAIFDLSLSRLLLMIIFAIATLVTNGLVNLILYRAVGIPTTINESIGLAAVSTLANQLPFTGGVIAKAVYLKRRYGTSYGRYLSATVTLFILFVTANGLVGLLATAYIALYQSTKVPVPIILSFLAMSLGILLLQIPFERLNFNARWHTRFVQLNAGWKLLKTQKMDLVKLLALQILLIWIFAYRFQLSFAALSQTIPFVYLVIFSSATILTQIVSITPGGLGIREGIVAGLALLLGFDASISVVATALDRLVATTLIIATGIIYTYLLSKKITENVHSEA